MSNRFENIEVIRNILQDSEIGLWCIEMDERNAPRLYADTTFHEMQGMAPSLSPEECYQFWYERIAASDVERVSEAVRKIMGNSHAEVSYSWNHPTRGMIHVRCSGRLDTACRTGVRIQGIHQDVSGIDRELARENEMKQTILNAIPAGIAVIRHDQDGHMEPEFFSNGFAALTGMTQQEAWGLYGADAMYGVHPDDKEILGKKLNDFFANKKSAESMVYRLRYGKEGYITIRNIC